jgi:hypothetical protein
LGSCLSAAVERVEFRRSQPDSHVVRIFRPSSSTITLARRILKWRECGCFGTRPAFHEIQSLLGARHQINGAEFKDVAATQLQRSHTPESYSVDFQPTCDGGRGRLDARYQYQREVQPPLGAFYRGPQLRLGAAAYADSSMPPEITALRRNRGSRGKSRSFFNGKKAVNSKQKVFSAMGSHAPGAQHSKTSFAVEQSVT